MIPSDDSIKAGIVDPDLDFAGKTTVLDFGGCWRCEADFPF